MMPLERETREKPGGGRLARLPQWVRWLVDLWLDLVAYVANHIVGHIPIHAFRLWFYRTFLGWEIGADSSIHERLRLFTFSRGGVTIGSTTIIGADFQVIGAGIGGKLIIGDNVNIAMQVLVALGGHELDPRKNFDIIKFPVVVEDHAVVFARATLVGCHIGRGAVVLPGAVVYKNVPPFTIVGGNPAKPLGKRRPQIDPQYRLKWHWRFH